MKWIIFFKFKWFTAFSGHTTFKSSLILGVTTLRLDNCFNTSRYWMDQVSQHLLRKSFLFKFQKRKQLVFVWGPGSDMMKSGFQLLPQICNQIKVRELWWPAFEEQVPSSFPLTLRDVSDHCLVEVLPDLFLQTALVMAACGALKFACMHSDPWCL